MFKTEIHPRIFSETSGCISGNFTHKYLTGKVRNKDRYIHPRKTLFNVHIP